jgi:hypothetical protein
MEEKLVCTMLLGQAAGEKEAQKIADRFRDCPYVYFIATNLNNLYAILFLSEDRAHGWTKYQKEKPDRIFGLRKAKVTLIDRVRYPKETCLRLPSIMQATTPCGLECSKCSVYEKCSGCPASSLRK